VPTTTDLNHAKEIEVATQVYAAINRGDIPAVLAFFDSEIVRIEPAESPMEGTYRGHAEIDAHFSKARASWDEGSCEPEKISVIKNKVIVFAHVRVRLKNKAEWIEGHVADVFTFRNGKVIEMRLFIDGQDATKWANHE
jgi:ketosteroid isomerase-like protein